MAKFENHCQDCERILGNKHEDVNRWMDELFRQFGPNHRRHRHCWHGVREAFEKFGKEGAKAAIIHIVRDCGGIPSQRTYDETNLGILIAPEFMVASELDEKAFQSLKQIVDQEFEKAAHHIGKKWRES